MKNEIRKNRINLRLTQEELSAKLNVKHARTISMWENGKVVPSLKNIKKMEELFRIRFNLK